MALPVSGLMLSERLARTLALRVGNEVTVEFLEGRQRTVRLRVGAVVSEPMGRGAYLSEDEMRTASGDLAAIVRAICATPCCSASGVSKQRLTRRTRSASAPSTRRPV